jgi:hypothetical protein
MKSNPNQAKTPVASFVGSEITVDIVKDLLETFG